MNQPYLINSIYLKTIVLFLILGFISINGLAEVKLKFAFVPGVIDPFYIRMEKGIRKQAKEMDIQIISSEYPEIWGPDHQIRVLTELTNTETFDLLIIAPTSVNDLTPHLAALHARGIEIITVDTYIGTGDYSKESTFSFPLTYIGSDNVLGGELIAKKLVKLINEKGKVYINTTRADTSSTAERVKGFVKTMKQYPDVELVNIDYNNDIEEKAKQQTLQLLQLHPDLTAIFGTNVFSGQGTYQAVYDTGLTGAVKIAAWDATERLIGALKQGKIDLVLAQKPAEMGRLAVELGAKYLIDQKPIPKKVIPGFIFFTRENVNDPDMQNFIY
jgi:ribose transport system substrate-binding protein